jgi:hypothetical protein
MFNLTPAFRAERLKQLRTTPRGGSDFRHAIDNPTGLMDLLDFANANGPFPVLDVLELGSDRGVSTEVFLNRVTRVTAVDPWDYTRLQNYPETGPVSLASAAPRYDAFMHRCGQYPNLTTIRGFGEDEMPKMADASFDLVYIDAVHIYQPFIDDVHASFRLVRDGGWIAGHDYYRPDNETNIIKAVNEIFGAPLQVFSDSSWIVRKPASLPNTPAPTKR